MSKRKRLKLIFYLSVLMVVLLLGYKLYLNLIEPDFSSVHTFQVGRIEEALGGKERFSFAVVGNINNSVGIFERKIIPRLNAADVDFVVSAGNAVSTGGEDKYRALHRSLQRLRIPFLVTFGEHEESNFGAGRYYEHFGPYFFALTAGNARLIFLDSTGRTSYSWQSRWLKEQLAQWSGDHVFLFIGHPLQPADQDTFFERKGNYLHAPLFQESLQKLIDHYGVDAVFSANLSLFSHRQIGATDYVITGGAGGLVLNNDTSFYHLVKVTVNGEQVDIRMERLPIGQYAVFKKLESLWFFIHSFFYAGYLNFLLVVGVLLMIAVKLYTLIFISRDYYPDYDLDIRPYLGRKLRVAMFTNNYLPFIGGVPISIERLREGLRATGNEVLIVAPSYGEYPADETGVSRVPTLLSFGENREFKLANLFSPRIFRDFVDFNADIVHVHHPFWLSSTGLWLARRRKVPVVYTYHTRLEHYAHYVLLPGTLFRNLISHYLIRRFANRCDGVVVPTYSAEEYLRMIGVKTRIFVQATGIDYRHFRQIEPERVQQLKVRWGIGEERVLISVSRLSREKNIDFLIDAVDILHKRGSHRFRLLLIGDGDERNRLQDRIDALGLQAVISLVGAVPPQTMPEYYGLGDLFVFASTTETQGMVILEAMAAGLPVVAVRSSGIDDVVQENITGFKTPQNLEIWCSQVAKVLTDDALRARLSRSAVAFAEEYDIPRFAGNVHRIYAHVLAARDRQSGQ